MPLIRSFLEILKNFRYRPRMKIAFHYVAPWVHYGFNVTGEEDRLVDTFQELEKYVIQARKGHSNALRVFWAVA